MTDVGGLTTCCSEYHLIQAEGTHGKRDHVLVCFRDGAATGTIVYLPVRAQPRAREYEPEISIELIGLYHRRAISNTSRTT